MIAFRCLVLALLLVCAASSPADDNQDKKTPGIPDFWKLTPEILLKRLDTNKNGFVEKEELPERLQPLFEQLDRNQDGKLDREELGQMIEILKERFGKGANKVVKTDDSKGSDNAKGKKKADNLDAAVDAI